MGKDKYIQKRRQHLRNQSKAPSDFIDRNYPFFIFITLILYPIAMIWSITTESGNIYTRAFELLNHSAWATAVTIFFIILIEGGVLVAGIGASNDITEGSFAESGKDTQMFVGKLLLFIGCYALSFHLSLDGSTQTTQFLSEHYAPPTLITTDSIDEAFADRIARQEAMIEDARKMTWRGKITRKGQATITGAQETIAFLEKEYNEAVEAIDQKNETIIEEHDAQTEENSGWAWYFSVFGQVIMMVCIILRTIYKSGENNLIANLETLTGTDIDGDGHVGKAPAADTSPTPGGEHHRQAPEADPRTAEQIAAAVAAEMDRRQPQRRQVRPFGHPPSSSHSSGPQASDEEQDEPVKHNTVEPVPPVPQDAQVETTPTPQVTTETVHVMVGDLKKNITTYYPRMFPKQVAGEKGSARESTRAKNKQKVQGWVAELEQYGIIAVINYSDYQPVTWKSKTV